MSTNTKELEKVIECLDLEEDKKLLLKTRWLFYVHHQNKFANQTKTGYHLLQTLNLVCGILIPIIANVEFELKNLTLTIIGFIIALSAGIIQSNKLDYRWRHHRKYAELTRSEAFKFFALSDEYEPFKNDGGHNKAFSLFFSKFEKLSQDEVNTYADSVVLPKGKSLYEK